MNYGGDLQGKSYTFQQANASITAGVLYSINKLSLRTNFTFGKVHADDKISGYKPRNLNFTSNISDANLCLQYDFLSLNDDRKITPYIFAGIGVYHFNPYTTYDSAKVYLQPLGTEGQGLSVYPDRKMYALTQFQIPLGIGFKYKVSDQIFIGIEFCTRYLFTDYLDDVSTNYPDENELFKKRGQLAVDVSFRGNELNPSSQFPSNGMRGNPKHNDNYYTSVFSFIYVFSKKSEFNVSGSNHGKKSQRLDCPKHVK